MHLATHIARFALLTALIASIATPAHAQTEQHDVTVTLPTYIGLRIVGAGTGPRSVTFDYAADPDTYFTAIDTGSGALPPTAVSRFDDVQVNVVGFGYWSLYVQATPLDYSGPGSGAGLNVSDLRVNRGSASGLTQNAITIFWFLGSYTTSWNLSTTPQRIARSLLGTNGWRSLGFNGLDYTLNVNGDEDGGTYTTTVTYYLTAP